MQEDTNQNKKALGGVAIGGIIGGIIGTIIGFPTCMVLMKSMIGLLGGLLGGAALFGIFFAIIALCAVGGAAIGKCCDGNKADSGERQIQPQQELQKEHSKQNSRANEQQGKFKNVSEASLISSKQPVDRDSLKPENAQSIKYSKPAESQKRDCSMSAKQ